MHQDRPSTTAWRVALRRAVHQLIDHPLVLNDPLAVPIVGTDFAADSARREKSAGGLKGAFSRSLRAFVVARSRMAEDLLAHCYAQGTRQYVLLGAGLDTFAYRNPFADLHVFEVDHPATQSWKRDLLQKAAIPIPPNLTFAATDFQSQSLADALAAAGFRTDQPALFACLGVVPYLTRDAFRSTLATIARHRHALVFDYATPPTTLIERVGRTLISRRVAALGEPFKLFLTQDDMDADLRAAGFPNTCHHTPEQINALLFPASSLRIAGNMARLATASF